jgi:two-component system cell cycle sensor histidine kinase/response regulator CckA
MIPTLPRKPSVLIVEDERIFAKDLQQTLCDMGYDPFGIASSSGEAIALVSENCPDIVLMDIRIKGPRDGIETAEILKKKFDLPVVYLTAHADEATIARAKLTEPHGYLLKPVRSAELQSSIEVSLFKHQMERRLRERERWFSTTLRSIADAVVAVDIGGKVTFMNPAAEALVGLTSAEAIGKPADEVLLLLDEPSVEAGETPLETALRVMRPTEFQESSLLNLATGAQRLIYDRAAPVIDEKLTLGAVMVFRDITEQKKQQKRLEFADRLTSLGTMAAGTAHGLNNPLTVVMANADLMADELERHRTDLKAGVSPQEAERRLNEIARALEDLQSAAGRMGRIVSDLQAFSRPVQETPGLVDLARCVERGVRFAAPEFRDRARLLTRFGDVPLVKADEARLGQVIINLLVNAAQSIPPGSADRNEVSVTTRTDDRGRAVAEVRDTGAGIPLDVLPRIFDPFFTTKEVGTSTGLGLSICHGIVSSLGGQITVDSQVGKGTTFRVLLPAASTGKAGAARSAGKRADPLRGRILVVDDEELLLRTIGRILEIDGHKAVCLENAPEALALIERGEKFDVIFCDLMMPNMTGMAFYETLLGRHPDLARRVVFMSGGATTVRTGDFLRSVANLLVSKPFTSKQLLETVQQSLGAHQPASLEASE